MAVPCFVALISAPACSQAAPEVPPGMEMHRTQAGALDAEGWAVAESSKGNFSVQLPCKFNDFSVTESSGAVEKAHVLGCLQADGRKFSATSVEYRGEGSVAKQYFDAAARDGVLPDASAKALIFAGSPALEAAAVKNERCGFARMVRSGNRNLMLVVEAPVKACGDLQSVAIKFFESLKVKA